MKFVGMRKDNDLSRPAIEIVTDAYESLDIVDGDGNLLMRLNIYNHTNGTCNCDVIAAPRATAIYRIKTWLRGIPIINTSTHAPFISVSWAKDSVKPDDERHGYADKVTGG